MKNVWKRLARLSFLVLKSQKCIIYYLSLSYSYMRSSLVCLANSFWFCQLRGSILWPDRFVQTSTETLSWLSDRKRLSFMILSTLKTSERSGAIQVETWLLMYLKKEIKLRQRTITNIRHSQRGCFWSLAYPHIFQTANKKGLPQRSPTISSWQNFWQDFHETSARLTRQTSDLSVITLSERHVRSGVCFVCARGVKCAREPVSCTAASQDFTNDVDWDFWGERGKRCQLRVKARHP